MGFGSYDESEQQEQDVDTSDDEAVNVHENEHEGKVEFATDASTEELLDKLGDIKEDNEAADEN